MLLVSFRNVIIRLRVRFTSYQYMNKIFQTGSVKELWKMSFPMMITFLSLSAMLFVDRIFLSWHSSESLMAAVTSGTLSWAFICFVTTLTSMSEVFVSQFNGANELKKIGNPVWQMLWLCLFSFAFFIPSALLLTPLIFPAQIAPLENAYFAFFMYTGPLFCIGTAVTGFFIGRGFPRIIQWMAIIGNLVNIILDPIFIFGIKGFFPAFGMMGAAYATLLGTLVQAGVLFLIFLKKKYHEDFGTRSWKFDRKIFLSCLRVGLPPALFIFIELVGWTFFYIMMKGISKQHIFIAGICQSILILFFFVGWGLEKGCIALAGNFIGQKKPETVNKVLFSAVKILGGFAALLAIILVIYPEPLIDWFFQSPLAVTEAGEVSIDGVDIAQSKTLIKSALILMFFYIILENLRWIVNGVLTAAGDTFFLLLAGTFSLWFFCLIPIYFFVYIPKSTIAHAYGIQIVYAGLSASIIYARYFSGKWKTKTLVREDKEKQTQSELNMLMNAAKETILNEQEDPTIKE